jgi:hypothetical protein
MTFNSSDSMDNPLQVHPIQKLTTPTFPPQPLLDEYKKRLEKKHKCHPQCALIEKMNIQLNNQQLLIRLSINTASQVAVPLPIDENDITIEQILVNQQITDQFHLHKKKNQRLLSLLLDKGQHEVIIQGKVKHNSLVLPLTIATHNISYQLENWTINGIKNSNALSKQIILQKKLPILSNKPGQNKPGQTSTKVNTPISSKQIIPVFVQITRKFYFQLDWRIETIVTRLSDKKLSHRSALVFDYPLLPGESIVSQNKKINNRQISINLAPSQDSFSWNSRLKKTTQLSLLAKKNPFWVEHWQIYSGPSWHVEYSGIPPVTYTNNKKEYLPKWQPWPGETLKLELTRPQAVSGNTRTILSSKRISNYGNTLSEHQLSIHYNSSQGGQQSLNLPDHAEVMSLTIDGKNLAIDEKNNHLDFSLIAAKQIVKIKWREKEPLKSIINTSIIDLMMPSVNANLRVKLPRDRWVIYTHGPTMGPVVLFWGMLLVLLMLSFAISKVPGMPLTKLQALLLAIGLAPVSIWSLLIVFFWFIIFIRRQHASQLSPWLFNLMQLALVLITISTAVIFIYTIQEGLLGYPNMHISGNGSSNYQLNWYQDIMSSQLPSTMTISLPIFWYRILMLAWALWLAFISVRWALWAWNSFSDGGYWKKINWKFKPKLGR